MAEKRRQHILFAYLKTGGGHLSAALALTEAVNQQYHHRTVRTLLWNPLQQERNFLSYFLENGYRLVSNHLPQLWILIFELTKIPFIRKIGDHFFYLCLKDELLSVIKTSNTNKIVILHFILIQPVCKVIRKNRLRIPVVTVVTDPFTPHPYWFENRRLETVVFSKKAAELARDKYAIPDRLIHQFPLVLKESHQHPYSSIRKQEIKQKYGFTKDMPVVLIAGGGEGLPSAAKIVRAFLKEQYRCYLAVVCGYNHSSKRRIEKMSADSETPIIITFSYVDFMADLMNCADIVISKGGPATVMETLILGKPLIITTYLYGQERGNVDFVLKNRAGFLIRKPSELVNAVKRLLENPDMFHSCRRHIESLTIESGTARVARFIIDL